MGTVAPPRCGPKYQTIVSSGIPIPGPVGPRGPSGLQGPPGPQGLNGAGLVVLGTVPTVSDPTVDLPQTGNHPGDGWIALDTGDIWTWSGSAWINGGKFGGPPGPQGIPGIQGNPGPIGPEGPPGAAVPATTTQLGSIIVGLGLTAQPDGTLSVAGGSGSGLTVMPGGYLGVNAGQGLIVLGNNTLAVSAGAGLFFTAGLALAVSPATVFALGGVIVGSGINVSPNGTISVALATTSSPGLVSVGPGLNVQAGGSLTVAAGAGLGISGSQLVATPATTTALGGVIVGAGLTVQANGTLAAIQLWQQGGGNAIYYTAGNVGIGIVNPAYSLDVVGQIRTVVPANTQAVLVSSGTMLGSLGSQLGGLSLGTSSADSVILFTGGAPRLTIAPTGAVTISSSLTVNSGVQCFGAMQVGQNAPAGSPGDLTVARNSAPNTGVVYFGNASAHYIYFDGAATFNFTDNLYAPGGLTLGGAINATGSINSSANLSATGSVSAGTTIFAASAQIASALLTTGNQVGIGTWPVGANALTVAGDLRLINNGCLVFNDGTRQCTAGILTQPAAAAHQPVRSPLNAYTNSTGSTMWVTVTFNNIGQGNGASATVNGVQVATTGGGAAMAGYLFFPVPNGSSYYVSTAMAVASWVEWY